MPYNPPPLNLDASDLQIIDRALGAMPYREVAPLIAKINAQLAPKPERTAPAEQMERQQEVPE